MRTGITNRNAQPKQSQDLPRGYATRAVLTASLFLVMCAPSRFDGQSIPAASAPTLQTFSPTLSFEKTAENSAAQFTALGRRGSLTLHDNAVTFGSGLSVAAAPLRLKFAGANREPAISGEQELPGNIYHAIGNFTGPLHGNLTFRRVRYSELYRGIDVVFYGNERELEFDFQVAPHARPEQIRLSISGAEKIHLEPSGNLSLRLGGEEVRLKKPVIYQERDGIRREIAGGYRFVHGAGAHSKEVRIQLGRYDHNLPLIIDPGITFATYFGGAGDEFVNRLKVNPAGEVYLFADTTQSSALPPHQDYSLQPPAPADCFLTKFSPDGSTALYTVVFDGADCQSMDLDTGKVHVAVGIPYPTQLRTLDESTMSLNLLQGSYDLDANTPEASGRVDWMRTDSAGNVYLIVSYVPVGGTGINFELQKIDAQGNLLGTLQLLASPNMNESGHDQVPAFDVDDAGNAYIAGHSDNAGVISPTPNAFQGNAPSTQENGFLLRVNTTNPGNFQIDYASYLSGSSSYNRPQALAFDSSSSTVVLAGVTESDDFPSTPGSYASLYEGGGFYNSFLLKLDLAQAPAQQLVYGTFVNAYSDVGSLAMLPGGLPAIGGFAVDSSTPPYLPLPLVSSLYPARKDGSTRPYLSVLSADARSLLFSTYLDGPVADQLSYDPILAANGSQVLYEVHPTAETGLGTTNAFQPNNAGGNNIGTDLLLRALDLSDVIPAFGADLSVSATATPNPVDTNAVLTYSITISNLGPQTATAASLSLALPASVNFQSATTSQGTCQTPAQGSTGAITCSLGDIANGGSAQISVTGTPQTSGSATATLSVSSSTPDPMPTNNFWSGTTTVSAPHNDAAINVTETITISDAPNVVPSAMISVPENITVDDTVNLLPSAMILVLESVTVADTPNLLPSSMISVPETVAITDAASVVAMPSITTATAGTGSGTVTVTPAGTSCGTNCIAYVPGTSVTVTATPSTGSTFTGFSGGGCGPTNPCVAAVNASSTITATFTKQSGALVPMGSGVVVTLLDAGNNPLPIQLTFSNVTQAGVALGSIINPPPSPPPGFRFLGSVFDIATTAQYSGSITVCFLGNSYLPQDQLWHAGTLIGSTLNNGNQVCATVTALSPFAVARPSYQIQLLYDPNVAKKSGSAYPIKIQLCDADGDNLSSSSITVHAVSAMRVSDNAPATLDDTGNANPDFDFRYDATLQGYIFNLSTKGYTTGTYTLNFTAGIDPDVHSASFGIK